MNKKAFIFLSLFAILALPFLLRKKRDYEKSDLTLTIITPHTESIRYEYALGFKKWYYQRTGQKVQVDWRTLGGTSELFNYVNSSYLHAFRYHWESVLKKPWSLEIQEAFSDPKIVLPQTPEADTPAQAARRSFLACDVGINIDLIFGGGAVDFILQAQGGHLVPSGILQLHPEWFGGENGIPEIFCGDRFWDHEGRWVGAALSSFGIVYNRDALKRLHYKGIPDDWCDFANPLFFGEVALADPTKSGVFNKAFEIIIQQQMQACVAKNNQLGLPEAQAQGIRDGWLAAMHILQLAAANARYFTDAAGKPILDVSQQDAAIGMGIDFYGRFQAGSIAQRGADPHRFSYIAPKSGSPLSVDPIGILRGAAHKELALSFMEYVLSLDGQKLIRYRPGVPGGPEHYTLRRPPIRKEMYESVHDPFTEDPGINPYRLTNEFLYHPEWTKNTFDAIRFIFKVAFIDVHRELREAWGAIIQARKEGRTQAADRAQDLLTDLDPVSYQRVQDTISPALSCRDRIVEVRLADHLSRTFRKQYRNAYVLAKYS